MIDNAETIICASYGPLVRVRTKNRYFLAYMTTTGWGPSLFGMYFQASRNHPFVLERIFTVSSSKGILDPAMLQV